MLEDNIFMYKRLSSDVSALASAKNRDPHRKTDNFFNFKFVKKTKHPIQKTQPDNEAEPKNFYSSAGKSPASALFGQSAEFGSYDRRPGLRWELPPKSAKVHVPESAKDPLKIHQLLMPGDDIGALIKFVLDFMKHKFNKSSVIGQLSEIKLDLSNLDMKNEIAVLDEEIHDIEDEISKWEEASEEVKNNNKVSIDFTFQDIKVEEIKHRRERMNLIKEDFDRKENQLIEGIKGVGKIVENSQMQCEELFRKILKIVERNNGYDSMVILKAMSRMGK